MTYRDALEAESIAHRLGGKLEELRLGGGRVTQQQHVDVAPPVRAVRHPLQRSRQKISVICLNHGLASVAD